MGGRRVQRRYQRSGGRGVSPCLSEVSLPGRLGIRVTDLCTSSASKLSLSSGDSSVCFSSIAALCSNNACHRYAAATLSSTVEE